jgi:hypothetical protein
MAQAWRNIASSCSPSMCSLNRTRRRVCQEGLEAFTSGQEVRESVVQSTEIAAQLRDFGSEALHADHIRVAGSFRAIVGCHVPYLPT